MTVLQTRPAAGTSAPHSGARPGLTVALACVGVFVAYLPITAVSVSLTAISRALGASTADLQWVVDCYTLPMAALILSAGVLGDVHGRKRVFLAGLALVAAGAAVSLAAPTVVVLWCGQVVMGTGAAALLPSTLALIAHAVPAPAARGRCIAWWASALVLGLTVGPFVAGGILAHAGWRWVFLPLIPVAGLAATAGAVLLGESRAPGRRRLDWPGQLGATLAVVALIYAVIEGGATGWTDPRTVAGFALAAVALAGFLTAEARGRSPMLPLALFRSAAFNGAGIAALLAMFGLIGANFVLSLFFGDLQHLGPMQIAYRFGVLNGVTALISPLAGRLLARTGPRAPLTAGLLLAAAGFAALATIDAGAGLLTVGWRLAIVGIGFALVLSTVAAAAVNSVPHAQAGMAGAANNTLRQLGGSLGPAVLGVVLTSRSAAAGFLTGLHTCMAISALALAGAALLAVVLLRPRRQARPA